eukprot:1143362-Pelagomonas_calceolata.AAC.6
MPKPAPNTCPYSCRVSPTSALTCCANALSLYSQEQEVTVPELPKGWREFHMPTRADVGVRMWREWLERWVEQSECAVERM